MKRFSFNIKYKNKKKIRNNKGFTLVELIVVIVILGILLAVLVPSLIKWIDKSKRSSLQVDCRSCIIAAQSIGAENYAIGKAYPEKPYDDVRKLAEVDGDITEIEYDAAAMGMVTHLTYAKSGHTVTYCADYANCENHSDTFTFDAVESSPKNLGVISDVNKQKYEPALNAVLNTLYDSLVKDFIKSEEKRISYVQFNNGKVTQVKYYKSPEDKKGNQVLYDSNSDKVKDLNDEISKALEPTGYKLQNANCTRIFFDWDGNIVANDKGEGIGGQGAPSDIRFDDKTYIKLNSNNNTWN